MRRARCTSISPGTLTVVSVAVIAAAQRPAERIGVLLGARLPEAARTTGAGARPHPRLLLHGLGEALGAAAHRVERAALGSHGAVGVCLDPSWPCASPIALPALAELIHVALALLAGLAHALLLQSSSSSLLS